MKNLVESNLKYITISILLTLAGCQFNKKDKSILELIQIANEYYQKDKYSQARDIYVKILEIDKTCPDANYNLAYCYLSLNDLDKARKHFLNSVDNGYRTVDSYMNLSVIAVHLYDYSEAVKYLYKAKEIAIDSKEIDEALKEIDILKKRHDSI